MTIRDNGIIRSVLAGIALILAGALPAWADNGTNYYYEFQAATGANGNWNNGTSWATPSFNSLPLGPWLNDGTAIANIDIVGVNGAAANSRTVTLGSDINALALVFDGFNATSSGGTQTTTIAGTNTLFLPGSANASSPNISFNFPTRTINGASVPTNVGVVNAVIDANLTVGSVVNSVFVPGDLTINVTGTATQGFGNTAVSLFGTNTFANLNIGAGILGPQGASPANYVSVSNMPATSNVNLVGNGASFAADASTGIAVVVAANNVVLNPTAVTYTANTFVGRLGATTGNELDVNGVISGNGDLMFAAGFSLGGGTVVLNSANTYAGSTTFNGTGTGTPGQGSLLVQLGIDNALPTTTKLVWGFNTNNNGGSLDLNGHNQTVSSLFTAFVSGPNSQITNNGTGTSTLTISGSDSPGAFGLPIVDGTSGGKVALVRSGTGTTVLTSTINTYSGGTTILGGTVSVNADLELGSPNAASNRLVLNGGTLAVTGTGFTLSSSRPVLLGPATSSDGSGMISVVAGGNLTFNGAIGNNGTGNGGLTLTGAGTLTLGGTNTYTGSTLINNGALALAQAGSLSASSAVTIASGATLSGTGTANGSVAVNGTIAPGTASQVGKLSVGSLTLSAGGSYTWKLADGVSGPGVGTDLISVNGGSGTLSLNSTPANPFTINVLAVPGGATNFNNTQSYTWKIVDAATAAGTPFNANLFSVNGAGFGAGGPASGLTISSSANSLFLNYTPGAFLVWVGGSGNWNATGDANWSGGAWDSSRYADFNQGSGTVTLQTPISATGLQFDVGGYTIAGSGANKLTLALAPAASSASILVVNAADSDTISAEITGSAPISKTGAGTLILTGPNSFSGTMTIASGTLQAAAASLPTNIVNNGVLVFDQSVDGTYSSNLSGSGAIVKQNSGTLTLSGGNTSYSGAITIKAGAISVDSDARLGSTASALTLTTGGTLRAAGNITATPMSRTINVGDGILTTTGGLNTNGFNVAYASTSGQIMLNKASTFIKTGLGDLNIKSGGFNHPAGSNPGTIEVDQGSLTLGDETNSSSNPSSLFGTTGTSGTPNNLVLNDGTTFTVAASTTANGSLNSLNSLTINGVGTGVTLQEYRTATGGGNSQSQTWTTNGTVNTPVTLTGTLIVNAAGNFGVSGTGPRITLGGLTLTGDSTIYTHTNLVNPTGGAGGTPLPYWVGFTTTAGIFTDNGHSLTFLGDDSATNVEVSGGGSNSGGIFINSGTTGGTSVVTGNWTIGSPDGTHGVIVSLGGADNKGFTTGNVTVNPYGQLNLNKTGFVWGTVGQTLTINGIGAELADFSAGIDGALAISASTTATYQGNVVLGSDSIIDAAGATGALTLTGTITDATPGVGRLQKSGQGNLIVLSSGNTTPVNILVANGTITVGDGSSAGAGNALLPNGNLTLGETSTTSGTTAVNFRNAAQSIGNLSSTFAATTGTSVQTISLNGTELAPTVLTINQATNTTYGTGVVPSLISTITGPGSIVLAGAPGSSLTLNGPNGYTGPTTISGGTLIVADRVLAGPTSEGSNTTSTTGTNSAGYISGATTITLSAIPANLAQGDPVSGGAGIIAGTTVAGINTSTNTITLSQATNAAGAASQTLSFSLFASASTSVLLSSIPTDLNVGDGIANTSTNGIQPGTIVTGINPATNTITLSLPTTSAGLPNQSLSFNLYGALGNTTSAVVLGDVGTTSNNSSPSLMIGGAFTFARPINIANQATTGTYSLGGNTANVATFSGAITIDQPLTISQTAGGTLNVTGGITSGLAGTQTITFAGPGNINVGTTAIGGGTGALAVNVTNGLTTFSTANTYTGGTTINGGKLSLAGGGSVGQIYGGDVAINAGGILGVNDATNLLAGNPSPPMGANTNATALINSGGIMSIDSDFDASPLVDPTSVGILALNTTNSTLSGTNGSSEFIGAIGTQMLTTNSLAPGAEETYRLGGAGGTLTVANGVLTGGSNSLVVGSTQPNGSGTVVLAAANSFGGGTTVNNGTLRTTADGALGSGGLAVNATAGAASSASVQSNETVSSLSSTVTGGTASLSIAASKTVTDNQAGNTQFAGTLNNSGTLTKLGSGTLEIDGAPTLVGGSILNANAGTLKFATSTAATVGAGVTANVASGATLELAGTSSALSSSDAPADRVHIVNHSSQASGGELLISGTNQQVGAIDGATGDTVVSAGASLTANHIVQNALVIGGAAGNPATVTIAASDANGVAFATAGDSAANSSLLSGALSPSASFASGLTPATIAAGAAESSGFEPAFIGGDSSFAGNSSAVPEPSSLLLGLFALAGVGVATRRQRSQLKSA